VEYGGTKRLLRQGEIAVINSTEIHAVNSVDLTESRENIVFMLQISVQFFRTMSAHINSLRFLDRIEGTEAEEIRKYLLLVMDEEQNEREAKPAVIHGFCGLIVALLLRHFCENISSESPKNETSSDYNRNYDRLKKVLSFVNEHYAESPSLNEIAEIVYVSPYYLSHFFTQAMGMTYLQYLNYVKVTMAKQSLAATDDAVIDILSRSGFANTKTFNRVFREIVGCSPSEYRKFVHGGAEPELPASEKEHLGSYVNYQGHIVIPHALYRAPGGEEYGRKKNECGDSGQRKKNHCRNHRSKCKEKRGKT
jgi:xylan 1,4-beta-xylosidase